MPEVSVVIPVYRVEAYLRRCVDSVLAQTFSDFEVILVDDGSPDNCGVICDKYAQKDARVRVIHQENGGLSAARNAGIDAARGEYLFFMDSDDVIHPQTLDVLYGLLKAHQADIAIGGFTRFRNEDELDLAHMQTVPAGECLSGEATMHRFFEGWERVPRYVSSCGKLIRRSLFEGIRFPIGRLFEDEYTTYRLYDRAQRVAVTDCVLYHYFCNDAGITGTLSLQKRFDEYDAQWERLEFFREKHLEALYDRALLHFLQTAQWDLIACREKKEPFDPQRGQRLEWQYREACGRARKRRIICFSKNYDYFVLANPEKKQGYRIRRMLLKMIGRL